MARYAIPTYAAFPYYTKGNADTEDKKRLQRILYAIKDSGGRLQLASGEAGSATKLFCEVLAKNVDAQLTAYLNPNVALVPLPSSTGLGMRDPTQWPCLELAQHLQAGSLGTAVPAVLRKTVIPTSHQVPAEQRPTVEVVVGSVEIDLAAFQRFVAVTLIDDVVSSGTNAMGVAVALRRAGYMQTIRLFAAAHTVGADGLPDGPFVGECVWMSDRPRAFRPKN